MIEVEKRAILDKQKYDELFAEFERKYKNLGEDDKVVDYHISSGKLLKITNNLSKKTCTISLKIKPIGESSSSDEHEVHLANDQYAELKFIFDRVSNAEQIISGTQKRSNFLCGDLTVSLKWSEDWQYHIEIEKLVEAENEVVPALEFIDNFAHQHSIKLMSQDDESAFVASVRKKKLERQ